MSKNVRQWAQIISCSIAALAAGTGPLAAGPLQAIAEIHGCDDDGIEGSAWFTERFDDEGVKIVDVTLAVKGLPPGKHGVHIHETGNCTPCSAAMGHFDPGPSGDPSPDGNHPFHSGDLVNLEVNRSGAGAGRPVGKAQCARSPAAGGRRSGVLQDGQDSGGFSDHQGTGQVLVRHDHSRLDRQAAGRFQRAQPPAARSNASR